MTLTAKSPSKTVATTAEVMNIIRQREKGGTGQAIKKILKSRGLKAAGVAMAKMPNRTEATSPRQDVAEKKK